MSKKKASASSREPSTGKQKRHSSVSTCLESVVKHEARVFDMLKNETIRKYVRTCFLWYCIVSMSSVNQYNISLSSPHMCLISGEKHVSSKIWVFYLLFHLVQCIKSPPPNLNGRHLMAFDYMNN